MSFLLSRASRKPQRRQFLQYLVLSSGQNGYHLWLFHREAHKGLKQQFLAYSSLIDSLMLHSW